MSNPCNALQNPLAYFLNGNLLASLLERDTDLVGIASTNGDLVYLNESGSLLIGSQSGLQEATKMSSFIALQDSAMVESKIVPALLGEGQWRGCLHLQHLLTGGIIPTDSICLRVGQPNADSPVQFAMVSRAMRKLEREFAPTNAASRRVRAYAPIRA